MAHGFFLKTLTDRLDWYDIGLIKWAAMFFVLTAWPAARTLLLGIEWYWYLGLCVLISAPIIAKMVVPTKTRATPKKRTR